MNNNTKAYYKTLVAESQIDNLFEELFDLLSDALKTNKNSGLESLYDNLIILSGRFKSVTHEIKLGIIDSRDAGVEQNKIGHSLISFINEIPDDVIKNHTKEGVKFKTENETIREKIKEIKTNKDTPFLYDAFFSFSSKDLIEAKRYCEELRGYGLNIFLSEEALKSSVGTSFFEKIDFALNNSKNFILLCTPNSMASEWVKIEYETFFNEYHVVDKKERHFIILKGKYFNAADVPTLLRRLHFAEDTNSIISTVINYNPKRGETIPIQNEIIDIDIKNNKPEKQKIQTGTGGQQSSGNKQLEQLIQTAEYYVSSKNYRLALYKYNEILSMDPNNIVAKKGVQNTTPLYDKETRSKNIMQGIGLVIGIIVMIVFMLVITLIVFNN